MTLARWMHTRRHVRNSWESSKMKAIVTEGAGIIGSYLANKFVNTYDVTVVDDLSNGEKVSVNRKLNLCFPISSTSSMTI